MSSICEANVPESLYRLCLMKSSELMHNIDAYHDARLANNSDDQTELDEKENELLLDQSSSPAKAGKFLSSLKKSDDAFKGIKRSYHNFITNCLSQRRRKLKNKLSLKPQNDCGHFDPNDREIGQLFHFCSSIAQDLMEMFQKRYSLSDTVLGLCIFDGSVNRASQLTLNTSHKVSLKGLAMLSKHNLTRLAISHLQACSVNRLVSVLSEWTLSHLTHLAVTDCNFELHNHVCMSISWGKLAQLEELDVSRTNMNNDDLELICQELSQLVSLNISSTCITRIKPLASLARLCRVSLDNLSTKLEDIECLFDEKMIAKLSHVSLVEDDYTSVALLRHDKLLPHMDKFGNLKHLQELDLSGRKKISTLIVCKLVSELETLKSSCGNDERLGYLGLNCTSCSAQSLSRLENVFPSSLHIAGQGSLEQVWRALQRHVHQVRLTRETLKYLYAVMTEPEHAQHAKAHEELPRMGAKLVEALISIHRAHLDSIELGLISTACLHKLVLWKHARHFRLSSSVIHRMFDVLLDSLGSHLNSEPLKRNTIMILYTEGIRDTHTFDYLRCLQLILIALARFDSHHLKTLVLTFSQFLRKKLTFKQLKLVSSRLNHVEVLLKMIADYIHSPPERRISQPFLKIALLLLWDFSDESIDVCTRFVYAGGIQLYYKLLQITKDSIELAGAIENTIIGLFCNLAEVKHLRPKLIESPAMEEIKAQVFSSSTSVSLFALGTLAHIAVDVEGNVEWKGMFFSGSISAPSLAAKLIAFWDKNTIQLVYNSLRSFIPLLNCQNYQGVQLYALWTIENIFVKHSTKYLPMLYNEEYEWSYAEAGSKRNVITIIEEILCHRIRQYNPKLAQVLVYFLIDSMVDSSTPECHCKNGLNDRRERFVQFCSKYESMHTDDVLDLECASIFSCWCLLRHIDPFLRLSLSILSTFIQVFPNQMLNLDKCLNRVTYVSHRVLSLHKPYDSINLIQ